MPEAFIVSHQKDGSLGYIEQRALATTVKGYDLYYDEYHLQLFKLIEELSTEQLTLKFNGKNRRKKSLQELWQDRSIKLTINQFIHRKLGEFLEVVRKQDFPITYALERKVKAVDFLLTFAKITLEPHLFFHRFEREMKYRLSVSHNGKRFYFHEHEVIPFINEPAWIIFDQQIVQIKHITGNMVKPFIKKPVVVIPKTSIKTYFEKFVVKVASKVNIESKGFNVRTTRKLEYPQLKLTENFLDQSLGVQLKFKYTSVTFDWKEKRQQQTRLIFEGEEVVIRKTLRNEAQEQTYVDVLTDLALKPDGSAFKLASNTENKYDLLQWLIHNRTLLEQQGFQIDSPQLQQKSISLAPHKLSLQTYEDGNDWFDIKGSVQVGAQTIPFVFLFSYIRANDPFYPLEDGTYFIIPEEWMQRYSHLAQHGKKKGTAARFKKSQYTIVEELEEVKQTSQILNINESEEVDYEPSQYLKATLRPYQLEGVRWLVRHYHNQLGACLADDMGLGKTLQTIATLLYAKEQLPKKSKPASSTPQLGLFAADLSEGAYQALTSLIILPASLVYNWSAEIKRFAPHLMVLNYTGSRRKKYHKLLHTFDVILTTYQTARIDKDILKEVTFSYIILDESQHIKNKESKVFKAINEFQAAHKISLSGTPIENSLSDLWAQMEFINPGHLGSFRSFKESYLIPIERKNDEVQKEELKKIIQPYLLRRTKEAVAKDLPELTTSVRYTEMNAAQAKIYEKEKSAARNYLLDSYLKKDKSYKLMVLQSLLKLRQIANHPNLMDETYDKGSSKFDEVIDQLITIQKSNHKVLVFSSFTKHLNLFSDYFEQKKIPYSLLQGDRTQQQRAKAIQAFQEEEDVKTFLISLKAGGTGLNLTAADYVFILDPWWNPAAEQQAIARAHRIGQTKSVFATKFIMKNTIEEKILSLQAQKSQLADDIINTNGLANYSKNDIDFLLG